MIYLIIWLSGIVVFTALAKAYEEINNIKTSHKESIFHEDSIIGLVIASILWPITFLSIIILYIWNLFVILFKLLFRSIDKIIKKLKGHTFEIKLNKK